MPSTPSGSLDPLQTAVAPRRLEILRLLWGDERTVGDIAADLPVSVPAVSQHLAKLRGAGLVTVRKDGRRRYYRIAHDSSGEVIPLLRPLLDDAAAVREARDHGGGPRPVDSAAPLVPPTPPAASTDVIPVGPTAPDDEMASWYRQGLGARIVALRAARKSLGEGRPDAADSVRRLADSLTRQTVAQHFPEVARTAGVTKSEPADSLPEAVDRLIGAISQEMSRDDPRVARILIVEDSKVEAALTRAIVSGPNRETVWAQSAEEAQRLLDAQEVDLIILDLGLPGEDGRDLLGRLGRRARTRAIPVILLTGRTDTQTRTEVMSLGADAFFTKPAEAPVLASATAMMLERSAESRQAGRQDPLTGLSNRAVFLADVRKVAAASKRAGLDLSLAILDTDRLAAINDVHGSEVGDRVMRHLADTIQTSLRASDHAARWSGGKFAVLFANTPPEGAVRALEKLQRATMEHPIELESGPGLTAQWHAGVAPIFDQATVDESIARATRRLQIAARQSDDPIVASDEEARTGVRHVLVIEDDAILADLIRHRLEREGFEVTVFGDGSDALRAMAEVTASAVILDAMLPGADGFEVLRELKSQPSFAGVPVVVLTFGGDHDARRAFDLGAADALAKPFSVKELVTRVSRLAIRPEEGPHRG